MKIGHPQTDEPVVTDEASTPTPSSDPTQQRRAAQRWEQQTELLRTLDHPNLVRVREVFEGPAPHPPGALTDDTEPRLYLVMNWVEGPTIADWVRAEQPDAGRIVEQLRGIAAALDHLHAGADTAGMAVLHRDVKPANVIVTGSHTTLVDFGLARLLDPTGVSMTMAGTPAFLAPEAIAEERFTPASDRYAFAATLYDLLTGVRPNPFAPQRMREQLTALDVADPRRLAGLLLDAMHADPERRPSRLTPWLEEIAATLTTPVGGWTQLPGDGPVLPQAGDPGPPGPQASAGMIGRGDRGRPVEDPVPADQQEPPDEPDPADARTVMRLHDTATPGQVLPPAAPHAPSGDATGGGPPSVLPGANTSPQPDRDGHENDDRESDTRQRPDHGDADDTQLRPVHDAARGTELRPVGDNGPDPQPPTPDDGPAVLDEEPAEEPTAGTARRSRRLPIVAAVSLTLLLVGGASLSLLRTSGDDTTAAAGAATEAQPADGSDEEHTAAAEPEAGPDPEPEPDPQPDLSYSDWTRVSDLPETDRVWLNAVAADGDTTVAVGWHHRETWAQPVVWYVDQSGGWEAGELVLERGGEVSDVIVAEDGFVAAGTELRGDTWRPTLWASPDGREWTRSWQDDTVEGFLFAVTLAADGVVATGREYAGPARVWLPTAEGTWDSVALPLGGAEEAFSSGIAAEGDTLVAAGQKDDRATVWLSEDGGGTWEHHQVHPTNSGARAVAFDGSSLLVGGWSSGAATVLWRSETGEQWSSERTIGGFQVNAAVVTSQHEVAVGVVDTVSGSAVLVHDSGIWSRRTATELRVKIAGDDPTLYLAAVTETPVGLVAVGHEMPDWSFDYGDDLSAVIVTSP